MFNEGWSVVNSLPCKICWAQVLQYAHACTEQGNSARKASRCAKKEVLRCNTEKLSGPCPHWRNARPWATCTAAAMRSRHGAWPQWRVLGSLTARRCEKKGQRVKPANCVNCGLFTFNMKVAQTHTWIGNDDKRSNLVPPAEAKKVGQTCLGTERELRADNLILQVNNLKRPTAGTLFSLSHWNACGRELPVKPTRNRSLRSSM